MISNSPRRSPSTRSAIARALGGEFVRPRLVAELVEDAVHDLRLLFGEKGMGDVDIFGDYHARRDIAADQDLIGAGAENGAQDGIDAGQPPACGELVVDQRGDTELLAHHAFDEGADEAGPP